MDGADEHTSERTFTAAIRLYDRVIRCRLVCVDQRTQPDAAMLTAKFTEAGIIAHLAFG